MRAHSGVPHTEHSYAMMYQSVRWTCCRTTPSHGSESSLCCSLQDDLVFSFPAHAGQPPQEHTLDQLLPQRFGPVDLLDVTKTPLLLQPQVGCCWRGACWQQAPAAGATRPPGTPLG